MVLGLLAQVSSTLVCALHRVIDLKLVEQWRWMMHVHDLLDFGLLLAFDSELLPGEILVVRTCKRGFFVSSGLCLLACDVRYDYWLLHCHCHCDQHHNHHHH